MKKALQPLMSSEKETWETPPEVFIALNREFGFDLDPCATDGNALCKKHFTQETDGLAQSWAGHKVYMNPPYGRAIKHWIAKAYQEATKPDTLVVALIPARTDTRWWHDYVMNSEEIRLVKGRLKFRMNGVELHPAPFPSAIIVFRGKPAAPRLSAWSNA